MGCLGQTAEIVANFMIITPAVNGPYIHGEGTGVNWVAQDSTQRNIPFL
jgi:hypothetical protein